MRIYGDPANPLRAHLQAPFKFLDFNKRSTSSGKMYIVCAILHNALTCLYGNSTSKFFDLDPPSIEDYFA